MFNFVRERQTYQTKILNVNGDEARETYEEILKTTSVSTAPSTSLSVQTRSTTRAEKIPKKNVQKLPFDEKQFFKAALTNDLNTLQRMEISVTNINQRDQFGWTALMMAACEGSLNTFQFLFEHGSDLNASDRKGNTALSLARLKHKTNILDFISNFQDKRGNVQCKRNKVKQQTDDIEFYCDACDKAIKESERTAHLASTLHRFNQTDSHKFTRRFGIPDSNVGFQMMLRQGWDREKGLGPEQEGHLYPVKTTIRKPRSGLGVKQMAKAKVTHFAPCDPRAVKANRPPIQKPKTKKDLKRELSRNQRKERFFRNLLS